MLGFVPLGCLMIDGNFYHRVLMKAMFPVGIILLLQCYRLGKLVCGNFSDSAGRTVKQVTFLVLELTLPTITTSLIQVFVVRSIHCFISGCYFPHRFSSSRTQPSLQCDQFENGPFLRAQLTLSCDRSFDHRTSWVVFAAVALVAFLLGGVFSFDDSLPE